MAQIAVLQPIATQGASLELDAGFLWTFDATMSEQHRYVADVTTHPVENGTDITDHIQIRPFELTLTGIVTNTPIQPQEFDFDQANRIQNLYDELTLLFEERSFLTVVTGLQRYQNMILKSIDVPRQGPGRQSIIPSLSFIQINTVDTAFVSTASIPRRAKPKTKLDKQAKADATPAEELQCSLSKEDILKQTQANSLKEPTNNGPDSLLIGLLGGG
jgi:hypothetical protein